MSAALAASTAFASTRGYAICSSPRAGTNFLCELLASTGALGRPREYFNPAARRKLDDPTYPDAPAAQVARILTDGATANGVYGLKMFPAQLRDVSGAVRLAAALPDLGFIRLHRADVLGQAISWARALQTEQYRSTQTPRGEPRYDGRLIMAQVVAVARDMAAWDVYFARTDARPLCLVYEDVAAAPEQAVIRIARWLGVIEPIAVKLDIVTVDIQRDALNEIWRTRFVREFGDPNVIHAF